MPRIPYSYPKPGESIIADKIRERRKDGKFFAIDGIFLNAPAIAKGYSVLFGAIWSRNSLDAALKDRLIAHEPMGRAAGLTDEQIAAIRDISYVRSSSTRPPPSSPLSPVLAAALAYTDAMTVHVKVPQDVFDALRVHLNDQKMMEATATIAGYNFISRFLVALDVDDMADAEVPQVSESTKSKL